MTDLQGQTAFVTGAASGIGLAAAEALAEAGASVMLVDRDGPAALLKSEALQARGFKAAAVRADVSDADAVAAAVARCVSDFGGMTIGVNCAGVPSGGALLTDMPQEQFERAIDVNVRGLWHCLRAEIPAILESGGGSIVNVSSTMGLIAAPMSSPYVMAKHAVIGLTKAAAVEYAAKGIRVNAVCPGGTDTPMIGDAVKSALVPLHPIGRIAHPREIAEVIRFLASPGASFVTGAAIPVDGGWTTQ